MTVAKITYVVHAQPAGMKMVTLGACCLSWKWRLCTASHLAKLPLSQQIQQADGPAWHLLRSLAQSRGVDETILIELLEELVEVKLRYLNITVPVVACLFANKSQL